MKILMRTLAAGRHGVFEPGKQYDVSNAIGQPMVDGGYASVVGSKPKTKILQTNSKPVPDPPPPPPDETTTEGDPPPQLETTTHPAQTVVMDEVEINPPAKPKRGRPKRGM